MIGFLNSFRYAFRGVASAIRSERNFRVHIAVAILVIAAGVTLGCTPYEWIAITLAMGLVFTAELMNTAIEKLTDIVSPDHMPQAGQVKDIAAAAVLLAAMAAAAVGCIIFAPKLLQLAQGANAS